jgi:hypothetical protein
MDPLPYCWVTLLQGLKNVCLRAKSRRRANALRAGLKRSLPAGWPVSLKKERREMIASMDEKIMIDLLLELRKLNYSFRLETTLIYVRHL